MDYIVFIYAGFNETHAFDRIFSSQSAFDRTLIWASSIKDCKKLVVAVNKGNEAFVRESLNAFSNKEYKVIVKDKWNTLEVLKSMALECETEKAGEIIFTSGDKPFLDEKLTEELLTCHKEFIAEYTFQDGYPFGFAPEVIHSGALNIILSLADSSKKEEGQAEICNESIFNIMKADINSFDIETVMAPKDYRLLRLDFSCSSKANTLACERLYNCALNDKIPFNAEPLTNLAEKKAEIQQTVPGFYNIQLTTGCSSFALYNPYPQSFKKLYGEEPVPESAKNAVMTLEEFNAIVKEISDFSGNAVVSLSAFGDCLLNAKLPLYVEAVLKYKGLSVLIETDGLCVTSEMINSIKQKVEAAEERTNGHPKLMWIVQLDAFTEAKYNELHKVKVSLEQGKTPFNKAFETVGLLAENFEKCVYPQFVRMNENEEELEKFYRFWHESSSPSKGLLIIQKFDSYCGVLPDSKPADLSPLKRNTCWHLKRDFTILADGSVPFCKEELISSSAGNVFSEGIEKIWKKFQPLVQEQIDLKYSEKCRKCDEYYTFNF